MDVSVQITKAIQCSVSINGIVRVSDGGGGGSEQVIKLNQAVTPSPDGLNKAFRTPDAFVSSSLIVVLNGQQLSPSEDYTITGADEFTFAVDVDAPEPIDALWVHYEKV